MPQLTNKSECSAFNNHGIYCMECAWSIANEAQHKCPWCNKQLCPRHAHPNEGGKIGGHSGCHGPKCGSISVGTCAGIVSKTKCSGCDHYYCEHHFKTCSKFKMVGRGHICKVTKGPLGAVAYAAGDVVNETREAAYEVGDAAVGAAINIGQNAAGKIAGNNEVTFINNGTTPAIVTVFGINDITSQNPFGGLKTVAPGASVLLEGPPDLRPGMQQMTIAVVFARDGDKFWTAMQNCTHGDTVKATIDYQHSSYPPVMWEGGFMPEHSQNVASIDKSVLEKIQIISDLVPDPVDIVKKLLSSLAEDGMHERSLPKNDFGSEDRKKKKSRDGPQVTYEEESADGAAVYKSYFSAELENKGTPEADLHCSVHKLRANFEDVRFFVMDLRQYADDVKEVILTPKSMSEEAAKLANTCDTICTVADNIKAGGAIADIVKKAITGCLGAVEKVSQNVSKVLADIHRDCKLQEKADKFDAWVERTAEVANKNMETVNKNLAKYEDQSSEAAENWTKAMPFFPGKVKDVFEKMLIDATSLIDQGADALKTTKEACDKTTPVLDSIETILIPKRLVEKYLGPVNEFFNWFDIKLKWLIDKVLNVIMDLPIVKQIMDWQQNFFNKLWELVLEHTGLGALLESIADKCNPFKTFEDLSLEMLQSLDLDFDASKLLSATTGLKQVSLRAIAPPEIKEEIPDIYFVAPADWELVL